MLLIAKYYPDYFPDPLGQWSREEGTRVLVSFKHTPHQKHGMSQSVTIAGKSQWGSLMDRAVGLVTRGCGFESRLWQEVSTTEVRPLSKAPNPQLLPGRRSVGCPLLKVCALGWVKCREHISLLVILCIIVYVTNTKLLLWAFDYPAVKPVVWSVNIWIRNERVNHRTSCSGWRWRLLNKGLDLGLFLAVVWILMIWITAHKYNCFIS